MAATFKPKFMAILLVYNETWGARACPLHCLADVSYMTCPSSSNKKLVASCNCCLNHAANGCVLRSYDGTPVSNC